MSLRLKVFLVIGAVFLTFFFFVSQILSKIISEDFSDLEKRDATENMLRVTDALQGKIDDLTVKLSDWAQWDDTYRFLADHDEQYVQSNLQNETFGLLQIDMIAFLDLQGQIVFRKQVEDNQERPFIESFAAHLVEDVVNGDITTQGAHQEIVALPEGAILYVARPVTSSDGTAPAKGYVVFGHFFDQENIKGLSQVTHLMVRSVTYDEAVQDTDFLMARNNVTKEQPLYIADPGDSRELSAYYLVSDAEDSPVLILRVTMERDIFGKGQTGIKLFNRSLAFSMIVCVILVFFLLNRLVLRKLMRLRTQVERVRESGDVGHLITLPGNDEFSTLADRINDMLQSLHDVEVKRKESEKRFRTVADSAPVMIWMSDTDKQCTYVNKVWLDYTGRPLTEELGQGWKADVHPDDVAMTDAAYEKAFVEQQSFNVEYRLRRKDGSFGWVFSRAVPHLSAEGVFLGYIGSCVDINERKEAENQKEEYIVEIEKMSRIMVERELKMIDLKERIKKLEHRGE